ncbi:MAG TPA: SLBB domain-containing protein, partial [Ilumatobacteraceae bacterium]
MDPDLPRPAPPVPPLERLREWVVWFGPGRLAATAFAVVAVVLGGMWLLQGSPSRAEDQLPFATRPTSSTVVAVVELPTSTTLSTVVVYVAGAVAAPGVYTLASPARVTDAITAAGGTTANADADVINLAATLRDGERIYVPEVGEVAPAVVVGDALSDSSVPAGPVDVNTASV